MAKNDALWRGTAYGGQFRVLAVEATQTVQQARDLHDLSPLATFLVGKMISAAAMLSLDLKARDAEVSLKLEGDGPLRGAMVICRKNGDLRGYAYQPQYFAEPAQENFNPVGQLGKGTLSVIRTSPYGSPSIGFTSLVPGEVAQNLADYLDKSEQVPSAVDLGVLIDPQAKVRAAGGFIIQQLPNADPSHADELIEALGKTPNVSDLMDMGLSLPEILAKFVFPGQNLELLPAGELRWRCTCSKARFARGLKLLGQAELESLREGVEPVCHFCGKTYRFSPADIGRLIRSLEDQT